MLQATFGNSLFWLYGLSSSVFILMVAQRVVSSSCQSVYHWVVRNKRAFLLNLFLILVFELFWLALLNRLSLAFSISLFFAYLIASVDHIKYENALTHFLWSDLLKSSNPGRFTELISHYIRPAVFVPIGLLMVAGNLIIRLLPSRLFGVLNDGWARFWIALSCIAMIYGFSQLGAWSLLTFNRRFKLLKPFSTFDYDLNYRQNGVLLSFLAHIALVAIEQDRPFDYTVSQADNIANQLNQAIKKEDAADTQPNHSVREGTLEAPPVPVLIVLAIEALWDINRFSQLNYCEDPWSAFREDYRGDLLASCFAGLTANSEFEFLTGFSMQNLHDSACPFIHLKQAIPALPDYLKGFGYQTTAIHSYTRTFYQRDTLYPSIGFEQFLGLEELEASGMRQDKGWYMSDESLIPAIKKQLDSTDQPQLIYVLTMQNHGPYATDRYKETDLEANAVPEFSPSFKGTSGDRRAIINYTQGVLDAGKLYQAVKDMLKQQGRPSLVLTFGDHLPGLGEHAGYRLYLDNGLAQSVHDQKLYRVPWCLWTNQTAATYPGASAAIPDLLTFSGLGGHFLKAAQLPVPPVYQLSRLLNEAFIKRSSGQTLDSSEQQLLEAFAWLQYDWLWGDQKIRTQELALFKSKMNADAFVTRQPL